MMRALLVREVMAMSRRRAFRAATLLYVVLLTTFALGWGDAQGYDGLRHIEAIALALLLPWIAARCMAAEHGDDLVMLSALLGLQPSRILTARVIALMLALGLVILSGLPIGILANRVSAGVPLDVVRSGGALFAIAIASTAAVLICRHLWADRVWSWLAATAVTTALIQIPMTAVVGGLILVVYVVRTDISLRYLSEEL